MARTPLLRRLAIVRLFAATPTWVRVVLSIGSIAVGVVVIARPTTALDVLALLIGGGMLLTGVLELTGRPEEGERLWHGVLSGSWIVLGLFVLAWPGLTVRAVAVITGILLLLNGAAGLGAALSPRRGWDDRAADAAFGLAGLIFGVLALGWPDITLLVVAVVFGASLIMRGIADLWTALRRRRAARRAAAGPPRPMGPPRRRWGRAALALVSVVVAVAAAVVTAPWREGSTVVDEFYAAPRSIPGEPGRLVRSEPFDRGIPAGAVAWRILYTTTGFDGGIRVASGLVVVPQIGDPDARFPVIDWNHSTTGFAQHCAPSLQDRPFWAGGLYPLRKVLAQGWAVVAPDYVGLGTEGPHPYLFGRESGMASLDAVRAARELEEARLSSSTVVWGHSQGGGAALWAGAIARDYRSHVWVRGVAAFAPASDPPALVDHVADVRGGVIFASYAFAAFSAIYPGITYERYVRPGLQPAMRAMSERCLTDPDIALSVLGAVGTTIDTGLFSTDPSYGELGMRLRENIAPTTIGPPVFIGQGGADTIVPRLMQDRYVERMCAQGQRVDYRRYATYAHAQVMETYSPMIDDAIEWTRARFAGEYVERTKPCTTSDVSR